MADSQAARTLLTDMLVLLGLGPIVRWPLLPDDVNLDKACVSELLFVTECCVHGRSVLAEALVEEDGPVLDGCIF